MIDTPVHTNQRHATPNPKPLYRGTQAVWYVLWIVEAILAFRFVLKLISANAEAGFTEFIYTISNPLVTPFSFVLRSTNLEETVFEWTTVVAMVVYAIIAVALVKLLVMGKPVSRFEAEKKLEKQEDV